MKRITRLWRNFRARVHHRRVQLALSIRVTIAALVALALAQFLQLPLPLWAVLTAVIVTQMSVGRSLKATFDYLAGTLGGAIYGQYVMYLNPETVSGITVSLQIVFAAIAGGVYSMLGPSVGALLTLALTEGLRVQFGTDFIGAANTIYGILLILCIIFMPRGILGVLERFAVRGARSKAQQKPAA